ncbi:hypothetical protein P9X10_00725 [Bacillus cereus]|nr:hypothetical protein [Bacillus cereus]
MHKKTEHREVPLSQSLVESVLRKIRLKKGEEIFTLHTDKEYKYITMGYLQEDLYLFILSNQRAFLHKVRQKTGHLEGFLLYLDLKDIMIGNMENGVISLSLTRLNVGKRKQVLSSYVVGVSNCYTKYMFEYKERM